MSSSVGPAVADPLVPEIYYQSLQEERIAHQQCNSAFLARILEVLMEHGTSTDNGWSPEALEFINSIFRLFYAVHKRESISAASLTES